MDKNEFTRFCSTLINCSSDNFNGSKSIYEFDISSRFLKTNLSKCAVIWVKRRQKWGFLGLDKLQITLTKGKEGRLRKSEK